MITVLSIDDDTISRKFVGKALDEEFNVIYANSGDDGIAKALSKNPDIILLDIEMPEKNGYEVCDYLKQQEKTRDIPVVFVSSRSDLRERMQGYEMGGADFIVKPFQKEDLIAKVRVLVQLKEHQASLQKKYEVAEETAMEAMSNTSELGQVMHFVERSYDYHSHVEIARAIFRIMNVMGLATVVLLKTPTSDVVYSSAGTVSPLESELVGMIKNGPRIKDFGCRSQINYPNVSLLIKNMPLEDANRYGRLKDVIPAMLSAADAKIRGLNTELAIQTQTLELNQAIDMVRDNLRGLSKKLNSNQEESHQMMKDMLTIMTHELPRMGLEEDQEEFIISNIDGAINDARAISDDNEELAETFSHVLNDLQQLVTKQNEMLKAYVDCHSDSQDDDSDDLQAVELF